MQAELCDKCLGSGHVIDPVEMGKYYRNKRMKLGYNQTEVANAMDIDTATLSVLESGRRTWTSYYAIRFEQAINILDGKSRKKAA